MIENLGMQHLLTFATWKEVFQEGYKVHQAPLLLIGATTILVSFVFEKQKRLGFLLVSTLSYPFYYRQVAHLMFLDAHETAYAAAILGIQIFRMHVPQLSDAWTLLMSAALAFAITRRGARLRSQLKEQRSVIGNLDTQNQNMKTTIDKLEKEAAQLRSLMGELKLKITDFRTPPGTTDTWLSQKETMAKAIQNLEHTTSQLDEFLKQEEQNQ